MHLVALGLGREGARLGRWIERQHARGLPHLRRGRIVRYRISDVEAWLLPGSAGGAA